MQQPHIKVQQVDTYCLVAGNPDRVPIIASYLENSQKIAEHRGLVAYRGVTPGTKTPVTVLTTGMGGPTTAIVIEEAYRAGARKVIRIGSCGSLVAGESYGIGSIYIPQGAVRAEGTSGQLVPMEVPAIATPALQQALLHSAKQMSIPCNEGLVVTSDIYYSPSGSKFEEYTPYGALCVEMESSVLFSFARFKDGMEAATILTSDGNLQEEQNIYDPNAPSHEETFNRAVEHTVKIVIATIDSLESH
ncbi:MAG: phosphorylase family protein [Candidatus Kariarchaeaceae archaeon]|jgi:uridine phosphorylase